MHKQDPLELVLESSSHTPFHILSQLWSLDSAQLPRGARGVMWLELINYGTYALLTIGLTISAACLIDLAFRDRSHGNPNSQATVAAEKQGTQNNSRTTRKEAFARSLIDNLDHGLHEDGEPLDLDAFWRSVRLSKALIGLSVAALLAVQISPMIRTLHSLHPLYSVLPPLTGRLTVPIYSLVVWVMLLFAQEPRSHNRLVWHLFVVSVLSGIREYLFVIGPSLILNNKCHRPESTDLYLLSITALTIVATGTIRTGPEVFRKRHRLYTPAVTNKLKEVGESVQPNVFGSGDSIIGSFMSMSAFSLMRQVSACEQVDVHDLPVLPASMQTEPTIIAIEPRSDDSVSRFGKTISLIMELVKPHQLLYLKHFCCVILEVLLAYVPHFCLQQILLILDGGVSRNGALAYSSLWIVTWEIETVARITRSYDYCYAQIDRKVHSHLSFVFLRKLLSRNTYHKPSEDAKGACNVAQGKTDILNLISTDAREVVDLPYTLTNFARLVLQLSIGCVYVWGVLGPSGLWGIGFSFVTYPLAYLLARWEYRIHESIKTSSDKRSSLLKEALQTISMIKMMASERFWFKRLNDARQNGFRLSLKARFVSSLSGLLYSLGPTMVIVIAFAHFTLVAKQELTASIAFTSIAVFSETRSALISMPQMISDLMKQLLGAKRIALFLQTPDVEYLSEPIPSKSPATETQPLKVEGDVTWTSPTSRTSELSDNEAFALRDLSLTFERGQMTLIAGKYGSGKTLLLLALLGEVTLLRGNITYALSPIFAPLQTEQQVDWTKTLEGLAYAPQVPWLQSLSIRENILFGLPMNVERYRTVLHACALIPDLDILEDSDLTEIGERGKILSGGQKARVSLARAIYSRASTILLDDVISAVDAQTSQHILKHCFQSSLMAGRTIIIASHAVEALAPLADKAIFLEDGTAKWQGRGLDLLESEYMAHLKTGGSSNSLTRLGTPDESTSTTADQSLEQSDLSQKGPEDFVVLRAPLKTPRQILEDENKIKGAVDAKYWFELIRMNGGPLFFVLYITCLVLAMVAPVVAGVILKAWTSHQWALSLPQWVAIYSFSSILQTVVSTVAYMVYWYGGHTARNKIYIAMQDRVLRAKLSFFTKTRVGSITQRFGSDLTYSLTCSSNLGSAFHLALDTIVSVVTITYYAGWVVLVGLFIIVALCWRPSQWYRSSSRQVRRLSSATNGPVNAMFSEFAAGAAVIRAFGAQSICVRDAIKTINLSQSCSALATMHIRWLNVLSSTGYVLVLSCTLGFIIHSPGMTGGQAGFILGFAQKITWQLVRSMELMRTFETQGVALERLAEYRNLETEDIDPLHEPERDHGEEHARLSNWPSQGKIEAKDLSARYAPDMPDILHKVSFSCPGGQRIGIVGATGGGKSTLAKAIFRFVDISSGSISIDDEDISKIPLGILRSRMGVIAQDPLLVSGTLRLNLDLEGQYTDDELRDVLRQVQLIGPANDEEDTLSETSSITLVGADDAQPGKALNRRSPVNVFENLDYEIESGGQNLSAGQKQLVVMARALLKKHKILVLDEATASIDSKTDAEISRVVHEEFEGATVLIIAHRLRTIMPCSKILVMDQGNIVQQGSPHELIQEDGGKFQSLCKAAGDEEYRHLQYLAQDSLLVKI